MCFIGKFLRQLQLLRVWIVVEQIFLVIFEVNSLVIEVLVRYGRLVLCRLVVWWIICCVMVMWVVMLVRWKVIVWCLMIGLLKVFCLWVQLCVVLNVVCVMLIVWVVMLMWLFLRLVRVMWQFLFFLFRCSVVGICRLLKVSWQVFEVCWLSLFLICIILQLGVLVGMMNVLMLCFLVFGLVIVKMIIIFVWLFEVMNCLVLFSMQWLLLWWVWVFRKFVLELVCGLVRVKVLSIEFWVSGWRKCFFCLVLLNLWIGMQLIELCMFMMVEQVLLLVVIFSRVMVQVRCLVCVLFYFLGISMLRKLRLVILWIVLVGKWCLWFQLVVNGFSCFWVNCCVMLWIWIFFLQGIIVGFFFLLFVLV